MSEPTETTPVSYNLSLSDVSYDEKYRINQGSTSQLLRGMQEMVSRLTEPSNDYQKELYPALKSIVANFVEKYNVLLRCSSEVEREVKRFNLHGYNGKLKNPVSTSGVKYNLVYKFSNFGDYLKTVIQRIKYIIERNLPQRYVTYPSEGTAYANLKTQCQEFVKYLSEEVEQSWNTVVSSARTAGGNSVQENLRKRTENQQVKTQEGYKKTVRSEHHDSDQQYNTQNTERSRGGGSRGGSSRGGSRGGSSRGGSRGGSSRGGSSRGGSSRGGSRGMYNNL